MKRKKNWSVVPIIGIYSITNKIDGKKYIGKTIDISRRWREHLDSMKNESNKNFLPNAFRKYGIDSFEFQIEHTFSDIDHLSIEEKNIILDEAEIYYISAFNSDSVDFGYNRTHGGNGGSLIREDLLKRNEAIRKAWSDPERKRKQSEKFRGENHPFYGTEGSFFGHKHTEETKLKMSQNMKGMKHTMSEKGLENFKLCAQKRCQESHWYHNDFLQKELYIHESKQIPEGYIIGRLKLSESTKEKLSASKSGRNNPRSKKIYCIETEEIFHCIKELTSTRKEYGLLLKNIKNGEKFNGLSYRIYDGERDV